MTDLLTRHPVRPGSEERPTRPLAVGAAVAGVVASLSVLVAAMALALAGWFDAGAHDRTTDALRVGADAWLLGQGAGLELASATVTLVPLGVWLLSGYVAFRLGRWAALTSAVDDLRTAATGTVVLAGVYGVVAVVTAVLASLPDAQPRLGAAFAGGFTVALLGGGAGIAAGAGVGPAWRERVPEPVRAAAITALAVVLLVVAGSAVVLAASLLADLGAAAGVLSRLHVDTTGGLLYTAVVAAVVPNAVLLTAAYLLGPGFAVGTGTLVSPSVVALGPVPAFPLLAALPGDGVAPWWTRALVAVPGLLAALGAFLVARRGTPERTDLGTAVLSGGVGGLLGGLLLSGLVALAGGSVGPGRMADVGAPVAEVLVAALVTLGLGGVVGSLVGAWSARRRAR